MELEWSENNQPISKVFNDIYYATEDGLAESRYVYLEQNELPKAWLEKTSFTLGELGFGTGLNFFATTKSFLESSQRDSDLYYISCEKFPLSKVDLERALKHWKEFDDLILNFISLYEPQKQGWQKIDLCEGKIHLHLFIGDVQQFFLSFKEQMNLEIDAWYFDGFAPRKNPEMWDLSVFKEAASLTRKGGSFSSFAVAGFVRRNLEAAGFRVEKMPGFGRKREMIRGILP